MLGEGLFTRNALVGYVCVRCLVVHFGFCGCVAWHVILRGDCCAGALTAVETLF